MVNVALLFFGAIFALFGWIFFQNPQTGFRIHNWPFASSDSNGLTEEGETPYRLRGLLLVGVGLLFCVASMFE